MDEIACSPPLESPSLRSSVASGTAHPFVASPDTKCAGSARPFEQEMMFFDDHDVEVDDSIGGSEREHVRAIIVALRRTFSHLHRQLPTDSKCGTTALCMYNVGDLLFVANAGDTRCVLKWWDQRGEVRLSVDHKASDETEKERIRLSGGHISQVPGSVPRVASQLAVTRAAVATTELRNMGVSFRPYIRVTRVLPERGFVVMATDGLWDKVGDSLCCITMKSLVDELGPSEAMKHAEQLVKLAYDRQSFDNISVVCVHLGALTQRGHIGACSESNGDHSTQAARADLEEDLCMAGGGGFDDL
eukprot:Rmarinus@m.11744